MRRRTVLAGAVALSAFTLIPATLTVADHARGNVPVLYHYVAAWNAHNVERAAGFFDDNVVYYDASVGTPLEGKDAAVTSVVANFINAAPDLMWGIRGAPIVSGDKVSFEWAFSGTNTGAWADGTEATNKRFSFTGATVLKIENGLIVAQSDYYDALGFFRQLGWIE